MEPAPKRPQFVIRTADVPEKVSRYPDSDEDLAHGREIGRMAGLLRIGLHVKRLSAGHRLSYPHAEESEEEFVYVLEGAVDAWIDGELYPMERGDLAAFPAGTGIAHTFINNGTSEAVLLVGGEGNKSDNRIVYPRNPERRAQLPWSHWWDDAPARPLGPHDGKPTAR